MNPKAVSIKKSCDKWVIDPSMEPGNGLTHCNQGVMQICEENGIEDFLGMTANQIYALMFKSPKWQPIPMERASAAACDGIMVIAAIKGNPHGHVTVVYPMLSQVYSGKWGEDCPLVCNIGKKNQICGVNFAFEDIPDFFAHVG